MNTQHAYRDSSPFTPLKSSRDSEHDIILFVTRELKKCAEQRQQDYGKFVSAVWRNRRLWTLLSADVAHAGNKLPDLVRSRILYLGEFVQSHSATILRGEAEVDPLIDVNLIILRGLGGKGASS